MAPYVIVVDTAADAGTGPDRLEEWYARHAEQVSAIAGVTRVERYWSVASDGDDGDEDDARHLALYHVEEPPSVMAQRFAQAKSDGRLAGSPFPARTQRGYRLHSVVTRDAAG
jgi:hypothetical protein